MLKLLIALLSCALALTVGILIGHYGIIKSGSSTPSWVTDVRKDVDENFIKTFLAEVDNLQIQENLK